MGTPEGERDWVNVANDLLSKCHLNLRLRKLNECDANVFLRLYENILGEEVPDYIATPGSQEDDGHNVQCVIDSLSLDYLQISLSHITGENVVRGDKESIKNLLEIFDGLLEYLKEEISEESQNDEELNEDVSDESKEPTSGKEAKPEGASSSSSGGKHSLHSWSSEELGSNSELIGLGVSARTFTSKQQDTITTSGPLEPKDAPLTVPLHSAIALQPPSQSNTLRRPDRDPQCTAAAVLSQKPTEEEATESSGPASETIITNGLKLPAVRSEKPLPSQQRAEGEGETLQPTNGGPRRVLFHTQPDVLFLTLQDDTAATSPSPPDTEEEGEDEGDGSSSRRRADRRRVAGDGTGLRGRSEGKGPEEPLSSRTRRNKHAEQELHHISEKLSHRLEELDQMLKRVLSESGESTEVKEEDKQSHHSDSIMERCRQRTVPGAPDAESTQRTRSLSPSPPRARRSLQGQLEDTGASSLSHGRVTNLTGSEHSRQEEQHRRHSHRKQHKFVENNAYEDLQRSDGKKRADLAMERLKAQQAEQQYREAILRDVTQAPRPSPGRTKAQQRSQRSSNTTPGRRRQEAPRKSKSMNVKENELLPVLVEELPHLHISQHALGRMWEQQMQQVDRLHALSSSSRGPHRSKLSSQVEEAHRKHDLLEEIVRKEREHNTRLRDFKERIQQQKSSQNRLREQRQQVARAKKYHNDFHVQHRARLMRARTKEERMFRQLFEEGLELQKGRLREQKAYAKQQHLENHRRHQDQIKSLENYYKDQFSLLAEKLSEERQEIQVRKKAQEKALLKMKRELRSKMEREIVELQKILVQNDQDDHFQGLEVQRLRNRLHMASFHYNTSYLH